MSDWQPISKLKQDHGHVLISDGKYWYKGYKDERGIFIINNGDYYDCGYGMDYDVTPGKKYYHYYDDFVPTRFMVVKND